MADMGHFGNKYVVYYILFFVLKNLNFHHIYEKINFIRISVDLPNYYHLSQKVLPRVHAFVGIGSYCLRSSYIGRIIPGQLI